MPPYSKINSSLMNKTYNQLTAIAFHSKPANWLFRCSCGVEKIISAYMVMRGTTKSCGCLRKTFSLLTKTSHGESSVNRTTEYVSWCRMKERCFSSSCQDYPNYGGRGIIVCEQWLDYGIFLKDMGRKPNKKFSLERINVNGNYEPDNCVWASQETQASNKRNTLMVNIDGCWETVVKAADRLGVSRKTIRYRYAAKIKKLGEI